MKLQIVSPHLPLDPALHTYIESRVAALPAHFDDAASLLRVDFELPVGQGKHRYVECRLRLNVPGEILAVHKRGRDPRTALDAAYHTLERRLDSWRTRRRIGTRYPTKYFLARLVGEGLVPTLLPEALAPRRTKPAAPSPQPRHRTGLVELLELLATRRPPISFGEDPIPAEVIATLAQVAAALPPIHPPEARHFFLVHGPGRAEVAAAIHAAADRSAPLFLVCGVDETIPAVRHDLTIEDLALVAHGMGLGVRAVTAYDRGALAHALDLAPGMRPVAVLAIGWPARRERLATALPELVHER